MTLDDLLQTRYVRGGRGPTDVDCWGLVRMARVGLFDKPLLPAFADISPADKKGLTAACLTVRDDGGFREVSVRPGAIATAWTGRLCVHVGIVIAADGRPWVLETDEGTGPALTRPATFEKRFARVIYYDD
ncbi:hypothetical protein [uncultured Castellaniella sp.]|uniref:hypothetical protein n=1 Tax=uncultured Castellaniella sp. TaxID=647907 RepID=UPI002638B4DE|nr:hypothetical protein [uncultured Castellaniella sp.]